MSHAGVVTIAFAVVSIAAVRTIVARREGCVAWWTAQGQLALPALHPADRALVKIAEDLIRSA